jgi:hypothetical protein
VRNFRTRTCPDRRDGLVRLTRLGSDIPIRQPSICHQDAPNRRLPVTRFNHVDGWVGSDEAVAVNSISAPYCAQEEPGNANKTLYTADNSTAWTFGAGLSIPALDLSATARTGYTNSASISFEFNANDNRLLCGAEGYPNNGSPSLLQVEPW